MNLKWLWASLMILGIIFSLFVTWVLMMLNSLGNGGEYYYFIPISILIILVISLVKLFSKNEIASGRKSYKLEKTVSIMKIQNLFYVVGVIFIFASVWYFAREYIAQFPKIIKLILLIVSIVVTYIVAELMRGADI